MWGFQWADGFGQDARYGARLLWRSPSFTAVAVLSMALGIGSTAALFNIADAVLFRPLAVGAPHELHEFRVTISLGAAEKVLNSISRDGLRTMADGADFAEFVGFRTLDDGRLAIGAAEPQPLRIELVSENYFEVLGVASSAGRTLTSSDGGTAPVPIVLSERLWRGRFGADPHISGRSAASSGPNVLVRLRPGVSAAVAEQRLATLYREVVPNPMLRGGEIRVMLPDASRGVSGVRESLERPVELGLALVGVLLLVACANTGGFLTNGQTRRPH